MSLTLMKHLLLSVPLLSTPFIALAQSNTDYSFSGAQICTLDDTGQLDCILSRGYERLQPPTNLPALTSVSTGEAHACGITVEGQPVCWGDNFYGQLNVPVVDSNLVQIDAGANHTCALDTNGDAICWGLDTNAQLEPPVGATFSQIDAAGVKSCGLLTDGEVLCWSNDSRRSPQDLIGPFVKIDIRSGEVCGLTNDGQIQCSDGSAINVPIRPVTPYVSAPDNGPYIDMAVTYNAICGLQDGGTLDCTFTDPNNADNYPLGEQFISIKSSETDILIRTRAYIQGTGPGTDLLVLGNTMCGEQSDGTLMCWDESGIFPGPTGQPASNAELVANYEPDLDARVYGPGSVEIFWTPLPFNSLGGNGMAEPVVEIYRNGDLISARPARFSYHDSSAITNTEYQIRLIDELGNPGPLSGVLSVNTTDRTVLFNGEPTLTRSTLEELPDVFTNVTAGDLAVGIILGWDVNPDVESMIDGFEIRVNGGSIGFTRSKLFVDTRTPRNGRCVEIIAVGFDESRLGARAYGQGCGSL